MWTSLSIHSVIESRLIVLWNYLHNSRFWFMWKENAPRWRQRIRCLDSITDSMDMNLSKLCEIVKDRGVSHATVPEVTELDTT